MELFRLLMSFLHVSPPMLVRYRDRELGGRFLRRVERHLSDCRQCRRRLKELDEADRLFARLSPRAATEQELAAGFDALMSRMDAIGSQTPLSPPAVEQVVRELETYLGEKAVGAHVENAAFENGHEEILAAVEPSLRALLGRRVSDSIAATVLRLGQPDLPALEVR